MNIKVVYHSSTGNTKKIADAIADTLSTKALSVSDPQNISSEPIDLLFIGDGIYAGKISKKTAKFIQNLNADNVKFAAVFTTYGGQNKAVDEMKQLLRNKKIRFVSESFDCKGQSWFFMNRKHPNDIDVNAAREFAKKAVANITNGK
jgi:Uncharacterized flavoproteins